VRLPSLGVTVASARGAAWGLAGVLLLGAASCGGGSGGASKADYVRKVSALCRESAAERRTLVPTSGNATPQHLIDALQRSVAVDEQLEQRIAALTPPRGDEGAIRQLLDQMKQSDQVALRLVVTLQHNDVGSFNVLYDQFNALGAQIADAANRYGLTDCTAKQ
jgi:hypothetical protein